MRARTKSFGAPPSRPHRDLDNETVDELVAASVGQPRIFYKRDVMTSRADVKFWYENKVRFEGLPPDRLLVARICNEGKIWRPVIIDVDREWAVEGRHRLAAALRCNLPVPIVMFSRRRAAGWRKF